MEDAAKSLHPAPRGDRKLKAVIALTLTLVTCPKLLKKWSGRRGSNPRRPAWESPRRLIIQDKASIAANADPWSFSNLQPLLFAHLLNGVEMEGTLSSVISGDAPA
jgi:hypothetical protein